MACYNVNLTDRAENHFRGHIDYIINKLRNPDAALALWASLDQTIEALTNHPQTAPLCADPALKAFGYRKKMILDTRYLCVCRIEGDIV